MVNENIENIRQNAISEIKEKIKKKSECMHPCTKEFQEYREKLGFKSGNELVNWMRYVGILKNPSNISKKYFDSAVKKSGCNNRKEYMDYLAKRNGWKDNKEYDRERIREWTHNIGRASPMSSNEDCSQWLGIEVGEKIMGRYVLSILFESIKEEMPNNFPGFDFIVRENIKINIKTRCLRNTDNYSGWIFDILYNNIADYFLLFGLDTRTGSCIHVWLIHKNDIVRKGRSYANKELFWKRDEFTVTNKPEKIKEFKTYEVTHLLDMNKLNSLIGDIND